MRKKIFSILAGVMMIALTVAGAVYARELTDEVIEGMVAEGGTEDGYLVVNETRYEFVDESEVDEPISVGDWVKIKYYEDEDLQIIIEVEIEDEPETEYEKKEVEGTVLTITGDLLILEEFGYELLITEDSEIEEGVGEGDYVKVKYYDNGEELIILEVELEDEDDDEIDDDMDDNMDDDMEPSDYCSSDLEHPALLKLVESYDPDNETLYETLKGYFCEQGFGVGEIMLALKTAELDEVEESFEELLGLRSTGEMKDVGWGEIWQDLGLIGNGKQENEETDPEAMKNKHQEEFQFEGEEEQFEYEAKRKDKKDKNENKPSTPPGQSEDHPGKGKGRGN